MKPPRSDDRKLAKWLKKICKTRKLPECIDPTDIRQYKLEDSIGIERCELKLAPLVESVLQPREANELFSFAHELANAGYSTSAETFVEESIPAFGSLKLQDLLPYLRKFQVLEKWRKVANIPVPAFTKELKELPADNTSPVAMEWLLQKTKPETLESVYRRLLSGIREESAPAGELLVSHLSKDPQGARLAAVLTVADEEEIARLGNLIAGSESTLLSFIEAVPKLGAKPKASYPLAEISEGVFGNVHEATKPATRGYQSAALARLTASLAMAKKLNESGQQALSAVRMIGKEIGRSQVPEELAACTWILQTFAEQHEDEEAGFTPKGARQWALTYDDARLNGGDLSSLDMLGKNCGLSTFETPGASLTFDSKIHEDIGGGLLPGDEAVVVEPGWAFGETILLRAKVKTEGSN